MFLWNYELVNPQAMRAALDSNPFESSAALIAEGLHVSEVVPRATLSRAVPFAATRSSSVSARSNASVRQT